jgi:selenocysteine lyase/cysteine desulfurase
LINADPSEVSFVPNTSTGEVLVVHGLGIPGSGGNVVTDALHFEGSIVHLQSLERDARFDLPSREPDERPRLGHAAGVVAPTGAETTRSTSWRPTAPVSPT